MEARKFPPPPPKPQIKREQAGPQTSAVPEQKAVVPQPEPQPQQTPAQEVTKKKANLRLLFLIIVAAISFVGATVCGYFLFG